MLKQALKAVLGVGTSSEKLALNPLGILILAMTVASLFLGLVATLLFTVSLVI